MTGPRSHGATAIDCTSCSLGQALGTPCPLTVRGLQAGQRLWEAGDEPRRLVHIREGLVGLAAAGAGGADEAFVLRGPGAVVGFEHLVETTSRFAARMLNDGEVCDLPLRLVAGRRSDRPDVASELLRRAVEEVARLLRERRASTAPTLNRVAAYLLAPGPLDPLAHGLSKGILARMLSMQPETLSRALAELRRRDLITDELQVVDRAALRRLVRGRAA